MTDNSSVNSCPMVNRIAVFNPYLQGGHLKTAEMESTARFMACAEKRGIQVKMFSHSQDIINFKPDFVFSITYQTGKLTPFPTYMNVNIPVSMIQNVNRFVRNILSCDGFVTVSPSVNAWLKSLCQRYGKSFLCSAGYFSVEKTEFKPGRYKDAVCAYMGTNWDGTRHAAIFQRLASGDYLKCYGPRDSWKLYPSSLFGGEIPFDGISTLSMYNQSGAGLCIGHPEFDHEGIANNRMYEIVASGAMPIASENSLTREFYGDSILYFNHLDEPDAVVSNIIKSVEWVRANPNIAEEMTRNAHQIFNDNLSMETYLDQMLSMHERCIAGYHNASKIERNHRPSVGGSNAFLVVNPSISSFSYQTISSIISQHDSPSIILLSKTEPVDIIRGLKNEFPAVNFSWEAYQGENSNTKLFDRLKSLSPDFIAVVREGDLLFDNYRSTLATALAKTSHNHRQAGAFVAASTTYSLVDDSLEKCDDPHAIKYNDFIKMHSFMMSDRIILTSILFSKDLFNAVATGENLYHFRDITLQSLSVLGVEPVLIPEVVSSAFLDGYHAGRHFDNDSVLSSLENEVIARDRQLSEIKNSKAWRYLCLARRAMGLLRGVYHRAV